MKKIQIVYLILITLYSCNPDRQIADNRVFLSETSRSILSRIDNVENGLLPSILIEGEKTKHSSLTKRMQYYNIPGVSIAIINEGRIEWAKTYGVKETSSKDSLTLKSIFQAASLSKPISATLALKLVEEGLLDLETPVNNLLTSWQIPENQFTENHPVTLKNLLLHTSGLIGFGAEGYMPDSVLPSMTQIFKGESPANTPPYIVDFEPGSRWRYSNAGYTIAQQLMTEKTTMNYPELMEKYVLNPLGMENSTFQQPLPEGLKSIAVTGHMSDGSAVEGRWRVFPEMAAGGLWTNPGDLCKYLIELQNSYIGKSNKILSKIMAEYMLKRHFINFGIGILMGGEGDSLSVTFNGGGPGYRCDMFAYLKLGKGAVIMTNSENGNRLLPEIYRSISAEYGWPDYKPEIASGYNIETNKLANFIGTYHAKQEIRPDFDIVITQAGLKLFTSVLNEKFELVPVSETKFIITDYGWEIEFLKNDSDKTDSIKYFLEFGPGTAERIE